MATQFKRIKSVTASVLRLKPGQPRFFFFGSPMFLGKKIDDKMEAATLVRAADLETGEDGLLILSTVMRKEMTETYPKNAYVGKCFEICITRAADKSAGVKYNHVSISEVAPPDDFTPPALGDVDPAAVAAFAKQEEAYAKAEAAKKAAAK